MRCRALRHGDGRLTHSLMLSIFDKGAPPACPAPFNLAAHVLERGRAYPDKTALEIIGAQEVERWSYGRLRAHVLGAATGLLREGLSPGDILLMRVGNTVDFPIAYLGAIAAGIVPVPTSSQLTEAEVSHILGTLRPTAVLHAEAIACPKQPACRVIPADAIAGWSGLPAATPDIGTPDRMAYVIYTSGTSGTPRAVAHAHRAIWARQMMMRGWYGLREEDRLCHAGAFNWTYTLGTGLMDPWTMGATALIPAPGTDHAQLPALLRDHNATIFAAAPGVYRNILKHGPFDLPKLRHGLSAGEKLSPQIREDWEKTTRRPIFEAYGMSECSTFISASPDQPAPADSLGRPQIGRRIAILGDDGPVPLSQPGVIAIDARDTGLMLGYLNAPEATAAKFRDGWFLTGDLGSMDQSGLITYLGRADDMMNAGGYRVSPIEVETALHDYPGIDALAATDVEIKPGVRVIAAFYTGPAPLPDAALAAFAQTRLARYKQPRLYRHMAALPTGANGKILRRALRDQFKAR